MKLADIVKVYPGLIAINNVKLPVVASYRISKAIRKSEPIVVDYDKRRIAIAVDVGATEQPNPNSKNPGDTIFVFPNPEAGQSYTDQVNAILNEDEDIILPKLAIADLGNITIEPTVLGLLDGIVLFEELNLKAVDNITPALPVAQ